MHDTDSFARMLALDSLAKQPLEEMLHSFERECEVAFEGEVYVARDNGAVFRREHPNGRRRKLDAEWTFGRFNRHAGYLEINGHVVHRIIASAFHGPCPSREYVVDHIDTNRQNNRSDNLRWVTRLDNILLNPITRTRIERTFGSLEAFFENPGARSIPNLDWMRIVTREQAEESRKRLLAWAAEGQTGRGGSLGDWLYKPMPKLWSSPVTGSETEPEHNDTPSLTASAIQREWRTPTEFPQCPAAISDGGVASYLARLVPGVVFSRNRYGESTVVEAGIGPDGVLSVVCSSPSGVKDWSHAKVFIEEDTFCHESGGTFFTRDGAMKAHCIAIGAPTDAYQDSIDDYC